MGTCFLCKGELDDSSGWAMCAQCADRVAVKPSSGASCEWCGALLRGEGVQIGNEAMSMTVCRWCAQSPVRRLLDVVMALARRVAQLSGPSSSVLGLRRKLREREDVFRREVCATCTFRERARDADKLIAARIDEIVRLQALLAMRDRRIAEMEDECGYSDRDE